MNIRVLVSNFIQFVGQRYLLMRRGAYRNNSLVIIKTDNIGDYVLFRTCLEVVRKNRRFAGYHVTLIGNAAWKDLALRYDSDKVDSFYWIDKKQFTNSFRYRFAFLRSLGSFDVLLNPTYSRTSEIDDYLAAYIRAKEKIASEADLSNMQESDRKDGDRLYTNLIKADPAIRFEFFRYMDFFSALLDERIQIDRPRLPGATRVERKIVFFPGGTYQSKLWSAANYAKVIGRVVTELGAEAIICGGETEVLIANEIMTRVKPGVINMVNRTTLAELVQMVANCAVVVGNETGVIHIANALGKKYVCVADGVNLLRFSPYPAQLSSGTHIFPPAIMRSMGNIEEIAPWYAQGTHLKSKRSANIEEIDPDDVFAMITRCYS